MCIRCRILNGQSHLAYLLVRLTLINKARLSTADVALCIAFRDVIITHTRDRSIPERAYSIVAFVVLLATNGHIREHSVPHISISSTRINRDKIRANYMLCIHFSPLQHMLPECGSERWGCRDLMITYLVTNTRANACRAESQSHKHMAHRIGLNVRGHVCGC